MKSALKIAIAVIGIAVPFIANSDAWWVGFVFGGVVLVWNAESVRDVLTLRGGAFLTCSTSIFFLVAAFAGREMLHQAKGNHWVVSPLFVAVFAGGVLLAAAHAALLRASWQRSAIAAPALFAVWYLNMRLVDLLFGTVDLRFFIALWQALYLLFMLDPPRRNPMRRRSLYPAASSVVLLFISALLLFPIAGLAQTGSAEIAGIRPGITTKAEADIKLGEPVKSEDRAFEYAAPSGLPGVQRVVITYFDDTTQAARVDVYLATPVPPDRVKTDGTLGARTMVRERARGEQEELYVSSFRGFIFSSKAPDAPVAALSYFSGRWLCDIYAERFHQYLNEKRYSDARVEADKAVAIDPDYARGYLLQGEFFQSQKNDDEAIVRFIAAGSAKYPPVYIASAHLFLISEYGLKKKWLDRAASEFQEALKAAANAGQRVRAHVDYAGVLRDQKKDADALKTLNAAIEVNGNSATAHLALADYFWDKRDYRAALPHYQRLARALDAGGVARVLDAGGVPEDMPQQIRLTIYFRDAYSTAQTGDAEQAIPLYQKVLMIDPKHLATLNNLGNIYRDSGRLKEAIATYQSGIEVNPDEVFILNNYPYALVMAGKFDEARQYASHQLKLRPKESVAMLNMARAWAAQGNKKEALEWLQKAVAEGYHDRNLSSDKSFENLRGDDAFTKVLEQMK